MIQVDPAIIKGFKKFDTTSVSDALDRLGIVGGLLGIRPIVEGVTFCGPAFTAHYIPCGVVKGTVGDFLDDVGPGQVVVIDDGGRTYCTVWGDLMTIRASQRGIAGTVIDGVCRDVPGIRKLRYPVFSKGCYMVTGKDRVQCDSVNVPVAIAGVQVKPGDVLLGDDSGALVIPAEKAEEVYRVAEEIATKEEIIEREVREGTSLREARAKMGYHTLQTRK
jgi:4-hydroxy-4-methyl-2-oxoglutarate aldolase